MIKFTVNRSLRKQGDQTISNTTRLNHAIRATSLRIIDEDGNQVGVMTKEEALRMAQARDLDLVEISPGANPPVAKIVDWGKYNYQKTKQLQQTKRNTKVIELKQMRFGLKIGEHDLGIKLRKINEFLEEGHKVKIAVFYRGRELAHKELGFTLANKVIEKLGEGIAVDQPPALNGKQLIFVIRGTNPPKKEPKPEDKKEEEKQ